MSLQVLVVALTKTGLLFGPRVYLLCIAITSSVVRAPALELVETRGALVLIRVIIGVISSETVLFGHIAHLLDWFPLKFGF